jgi:cytidine deaminase
MNDDALIAEARRMVGQFALSDPDWTAGSVAAALVTVSGRVYTGICLDLACGIGFCAEHAAIAAMLQQRETAIRTIVAVSQSRILPPCGRCRELMIQVDRRNADCRVLLGQDESVPLSELLPHHWLFA